MNLSSRRLFGGLAAATLATVVLLGAASATPLVHADHAPANKAERKYRCTKCHQVFTFDHPGNYKCPNCNKPLIPAN